MNSEERTRYAREVLEAVYSCDPEDAPVTTADFWEVQKWMDRDIPLAVILQAVEDLPKHPSVRYVKPAVEAEWERVQRARGSG
jgi:hypothetical protein